MASKCDKCGEYHADACHCQCEDNLGEAIKYLEQEHHPCNKTHCKICIFIKEFQWTKKS